MSWLRVLLQARMAPYVLLAIGLALAALIGWAVRVDTLRADWKAKHAALSAEADTVLAAVRLAAENPKLRWRDAADQVAAIGASRASWKLTANLQSERIAELGAETARLKALGADLRRQAEAAIATREGVIRKLEAIAMTPGERADCARQLADAEAALDAVWRAGL